MSAFSLPWYAVVGTNKALEAELPYVACILIGVVGPTAGRFLIDLTCGVTPQHFVRGEWFVGTAILTSVVYLIADAGLRPDHLAGDPHRLRRRVRVPHRGPALQVGGAPADRPRGPSGPELLTVPYGRPAGGRASGVGRGSAKERGPRTGWSR